LLGVAVSMMPMLLPLLQVHAQTLPGSSSLKAASVRHLELVLQFSIRCTGR
jgi:hypothetical protein